MSFWNLLSLSSLSLSLVFFFKKKKNRKKRISSVQVQNYTQYTYINYSLFLNHTNIYISELPIIRSFLRPIDAPGKRKRGKEREREREREMERGKREGN